MHHPMDHTCVRRPKKWSAVHVWVKVAAPAASCTHASVLRDYDLSLSPEAPLSPPLSQRLEESEDEGKRASPPPPLLSPLPSPKHAQRSTSSGDEDMCDPLDDASTVGQMAPARRSGRRRNSRDVEAAQGPFCVGCASIQLLGARYSHATCDCMLMRISCHSS